MTRQGSSQDISRLSEAGRRLFRVAAIFCAIIAAAVVLFPAAGLEAQQRGGAGAGAGDRALAQQLVSRTISSYTSYTRMPFTDSVSEDFPTDRYAFVNRVERSFYAASPTSIDYFLGMVTATGDKLAVSFRWNKKSMVRSTGLQRKSQGDCTFVYRNEGGEWRLYDIKGQSPF